jgi:hypothetical protein
LTGRDDGTAVSEDASAAPRFRILGWRRSRQLYRYNSHLFWDVDTSLAAAVDTECAACTLEVGWSRLPAALASVGRCHVDVTNAAYESGSWWTMSQRLL